MFNLLRSENGRLTGTVRTAIVAAAIIDLAVGLLWLFAPEIGLPQFLWPSPVPPVLMRFIGAIVTANGVGALLVVWWNRWQSARTLFAVAFVYGLIVLVALLYHLLLGTAAPFFWGYVLADALFLIPIGTIYWANEFAPGVSEQLAMT